MPTPEREMPKSLRDALVLVLAAVMTAAATKFGLDSNSLQSSILTIAFALAALGSMAYSWLATRMEAKKSKTAEIIAPGITSLPIPPGAEISTHISINDPATADDPIIITNKTTLPLSTKGD